MRAARVDDRGLADNHRIASERLRFLGLYLDQFANQIADDAAAVVVSEETGVISFVQNGEITRYLNSSSLRELIRDALEPQRRLFEVVSPARRAQRKAEAAADASREQVSETYIK